MYLVAPKDAKLVYIWLINDPAPQSTFFYKIHAIVQIPGYFGLT